MIILVGLAQNVEHTPTGLAHYVLLFIIILQKRPAAGSRIAEQVIEKMQKVIKKEICNESNLVEKHCGVVKYE